MTTYKLSSRHLVVPPELHSGASKCLTEGRKPVANRTREKSHVDNTKLTESGVREIENGMRCDAQRLFWLCIAVVECIIPPSLSLSSDNQ